MTISLAVTNLNRPVFIFPSFRPSPLAPLPYTPYDSPSPSSFGSSIFQLLLHLVVGLYLLLAPPLLALTTDPLPPHHHPPPHTHRPSSGSIQFMSNMKICVACPFFAFSPNLIFPRIFFCFFFGPCPFGHILSCCSLFPLLHFILHFYFRFPARCSVFSCCTPIRPTVPIYCANFLPSCVI